MADGASFIVLPQLILAVIRKHQASGTPPILLACSGGIDSQVLLHAAAAIWPAASLVVAHVHHGLQPQADDWLKFCQETATARRLPFMARRLPPLPKSLRSGVEAWARRLRYRALAEMAAEAGAGIVLTAHHANDQLETHHLRRLRGAGPLGLGGMRSRAPLPGSPDRLLLRPFLDIDRQRIAQYAWEHELDWVDDPSNQDLRYARNRIRHQMGGLVAPDPATLQQGLAAIVEFQQLADAVRRQATQDLAACRLMLAPTAARWGGATGGITARGGFSLSRASLARLPDERAAEAIRLWLQEQGCRMPSRARLAELVRQLLGARSAHARLQHDGLWLLRYRDRIDAAAELPAPLTPTWFRWSGEPLLTVAGQQFLFHLGQASGRGGAGMAGMVDDAAGAVPGVGPGVDASWLAGVDLMMDTARGNDRLRLLPHGHHRSWKNLSQERGIPPWMRAALPVLRLDGRLIYAAPFGMHSGGTENLAHAGNHDRVVIEWVAPPQSARWI